MHVWIDQDLCTGDGLCTDHCPDVFVLLEDGIAYVREVSINSVGNDPGGRLSMVRVPSKLEANVVDAAIDCPGECIFVDDDPVHDLSALCESGEHTESHSGSNGDRFGSTATPA
jgi:ferredoxin